METAIISTTVILVAVECSECHIRYAMPEDLKDRAQRDQKVIFFCPNGHRQVYAETEVMRLKHKLDQAEADREWYKTNMNGALQEVTIKKREITRLRNRAKVGVCPKCHRTIKQAADHMKSCHFGTEAARKVAEEHKGGQSMSPSAEGPKIE